MSMKIRRVQYFTTTAADRPGSAYEVLTELARHEINLLAFNCVPVGPSTVHLMLFPEDADRLQMVSSSMGLQLSPVQEALVAQGDDQIGVLADIHRQLFDAQINVYASNGVTDANGSFGYLLFVRPDDIERACTTLGC